MCRSVLSALFALALCKALEAQQMLPIGNEFRVNQNVPSDQYLPQVAVGPGNDLVIVWKSWQQDDNTASIYFRRYNSAYVALSNELLVATGASYQPSNVVKVLYWTAGKYIIAWNDGSNVNMRVLNTDNTMSTIVPLTGNAQWDIAVKGDTLALLYGSGNDALHLLGYDLGTNSFIGSPVLVTEDPGNDYDLPNIRFRNDGGLVAVYGRGNYPNRIYRKTFDSTFLAEINETIVHDQNNSLNCIDVSTNASDELLISTKWGVNGTDVYKVWLLDVNGNAIISDLGTYSCGYAYYTSECALFDNGDFVTVMGNWTSLNDPDDYEVRGFYAHDYNAQNTGVVVMNTTTPGRQTYPAVEKRSDGGFVVVWEGNGFQGDTQGINARGYAGATFPGVHPTSNNTLVVDETGSSQVLQLELGTQPTGNVVIDLSVDDATEASINVAQMTFTPADWDQPQAVTVTGVDDVLDDGDIHMHVVATMDVQTADATYAAMPPTNFAVTNLDDDATFTMPQAQTFCRSDGLNGVNVLITNIGAAITNVNATSDDQSIVDDADITVTPVNSTTYAIAIAGLGDNQPGMATIDVSATDGLFTYIDAFDVTTLGEVPLILQNGGDLQCSTTGVSYQWFVDGSFIPAATGPTWTPEQNGEYTVLVVDADGCYNNSAPYLFSSTGITQQTAPGLWLGPLTDALSIRSSHAGTIRLMDLTGRSIATFPVQVGVRTIALPDLAKGVYLLQEDGEGTIRVLKQ
ncbi:MAG: hypothetical protein H6597_04240 [Flavobacteriales bacterium]|nr:hypothetical protein [Flavobacteriales bacterium]